MRIGGRKQNGEWRALRDPEQGGLLDASRVHHRTQIVHAHVETREFADAIGSAGTSLVEGDDARVARKARQEASEVGLVPVVLDVRHEARHQNKVDRTVAERLVGNVDVSAPGVLRNRLHT